jgi:hypothetical protein
MNSLTYLTSEAFSGIPTDLVADLQRMLSVDAASRPSAMAFTGKVSVDFFLSWSIRACSMEILDDVTDGVSHSLTTLTVG